MLISEVARAAGVKVSILSDRTETVRASVEDVQFTLVLTISALGVAPQPPAFSIPVPAVGYRGLPGGLAFAWQKSAGVEVAGHKSAEIPREVHSSRSAWRRARSLTCMFHTSATDFSPRAERERAARSWVGSAQWSF